jgi:hypothetical protein
MDRCGSTRLRCLRAAGAHGPQGGNDVFAKTRRFISDNPGVDRQATERIVAARQRQHARALKQFAA